MRRVYYAFFLRAITHTVSVHATVLVLSFLALTQVVSIPNVWANMMEVKVGEILSFFINALLNTQSATIFLLVVIAATFSSFLWRLFKDRQFEMAESEWVQG